MRLSTPLKVALIVAFAAVLAVGGVVGVAFAHDRSEYDIVPDNTSVNGVDVSGLTEDEAIALVRSQLTAASQNVSVTLVDPNTGETYPLTVENSVSYNIAASVEDALDRNRDRSALSRIMEDATGDELAPLDIPLEYQVDSSSVYSLVSSMAGTINRDPADAYRDFNDDDTVTLHNEVYGRTLDVDATAAAVTTQLQSAVSSGMSAADLTANPIQVPMTAATAEPAVKAADLPPCIIINYDTTTLYVYGTDPTTPIFECAIGYGRGTDEDGTFTSPEGLHYIEYKDAAPTWSNPDPTGWGSNLPAFVEAGPDNPLGLRALKVSDAPMIYLHGVNNPWLTHNNESHGCINIYNDDIVQLFDLIPDPSTVSTPIYVYFHGTQATYPGGAIDAYYASLGY
ncbi:MAG: L,D-transpeptidase family protein [Coriobacteriia bacterium]|nr:L,D-transpeptidase family protein [Coriobacteriia bacterium]